jgi:hypothetical protein
MSFIKFLKNICKQSNIKIYGSFVRSIFEKIFVSTADVGYADPINHDIDIVIFENKHAFTAEKDKFFEFISLMQIVSNTEKYDFNFYGFKVIDVVEKTINPNNLRPDSGIAKKFLIDIPHYVIMLQKDNFKIKIDMLGYKTENTEFNTWQNEFNINSLAMTENGIFSKDFYDLNVSESYNLYETINSIITKTAICNLPFNHLLNGFTHKYRNEKSNIVNQIVWFFSHRMKIITLGYSNITSDINFFDYVIERNEPCLLSGNEPPYIKIKLACDHYMSIMALAGLVNIRSSEWTDAIKCPFCRSDLNFALIDVPSNKIIIPKTPEKEMESIDDYEVADDLFSDENIEYITTIINKQSLNIVPDSIDNDTWDATGITEFIRPDLRASYERGRRNEDVRRVHPVVGRRVREDYLQ